MPWHCPACNSTIRLSDTDSRPRVGERYRCHVCRLTLELDEHSDKLAITPLDGDHSVEPKTERARAIPSPIAKPKPK